MFCRGCHYPLTRLAGGRCPECGRGFDPDDPTSFAARPGERARLLRSIATSVGFNLVLVVAMLGLARVVTLLFF